MARMYSGKKGKASSKKPLLKAKPTWVRYESKEVELLITKIAKEEKTPAEIGIVLRDSYGVPDVRKATGKKIAKIMKDNKLLPQIPEDLMSMIKRSITLRKHLGENKHDMTAKRGAEIVESRIRAMVKYYKSGKVLPRDWSYDPEKVKLLIS
jgi:small subunit ribosomal protein S15